MNNTKTEQSFLVSVPDSVESVLLDELEQRLGVTTNRITSFWMGKLEESIEFDLLTDPNDIPANLTFLTHRQILERRILVEELCGINTADTKRELARRSIMAGVFIKP